MQPTYPVHTSFWYHLLTLAVLVSALSLGSYFAYRYQYVEPLSPWMASEQARTQIVVALTGLLGAAAQLSIAWAKDANSQLTGASQRLPCVLEPAGYLLKLLWGSLTAVMANLAVQTGATITVATPSVSPGTGASLKAEASLLLGFCVGLTAFRMLTWLSGLFRPRPNNDDRATPADAPSATSSGPTASPPAATKTT